MCLTLILTLFETLVVCDESMRITVYKMLALLTRLTRLTVFTAITTMTTVITAI